MDRRPSPPWQGIGLGIQDAVNLGWKLAQVVKGIAPDSLLDTYHAERHPAGARALKHTMAQSIMQRADPRIGALADTVAGLLNLGAPGSIAPGPWADRVQLVDATYDGGWELPVIGPVSAPAAVLIRPDGHVAWTGDGTQPVLEDALASWFGPARH